MGSEQQRTMGSRPDVGLKRTSCFRKTGRRFSDQKHELKRAVARRGWKKRPALALAIGAGVTPGLPAATGAHT